MDPLKPEELRLRARELLAASMMATDPERRAGLIQLPPIMKSWPSSWTP